MKSIVRLVIVVILALLVSTGTYFFAIKMVTSLYDYQSPLHQSPPVPGQALGNQQARQVVFILIDALRYDTSLKVDVMPTLSRLRSQGAYAQMRSRAPSYSSPGYGVLLTGAWPELSSSAAFNLNYENIRMLSQDNIFSSANRLGLKTGISAFYWFEKLVPQNAVDVHFYTPDEDHEADVAVVEAALPWIGSGDYDLILIHIDQVDYAGHHEGGPQNLNWDEAASRADDLVSRIITIMDLEQDVVLICSDHGQIDAGGHGGGEAVTTTEPFLLVGKGIQQGDYGEINMVDVAPTIAALLGINLPASTQGQAQVQMISTWDPNQQETLTLFTARQQTQLLEKYSQAIGMPLESSQLVADAQKNVSDYQRTLEKIRSQRLTRERLPRIALGFLVIGLLIFALIRISHKLKKQFLWGGFLYVILFHLAYLTLGAGLYSYSVIVTDSSFIVTNGIITILTLLVVWAILSFLWKRSMKPVELASISVLLALFLAFVNVLPVLVHWMWNGMYANWTLPNLGLHFVALLSMVQIMFLSGGGLLLAGISFLLYPRTKTQKP